MDKSAGGVKKENIQITDYSFISTIVMVDSRDGSIP
jgi:hypothetical protein